MAAPVMDQPTTDVTAVVGEPSDPFALDITFIENSPAAEMVLACSTSDNCGSSCPSACTTSGS